MTPTLAAGAPPAGGDYDADIIILTIGRFADTVAAVQSATTQVGGRFHVTVLDQGSTAETVAQFAAAFSGLADFAYYTVPGNLGVGGGRNALAALGHGQIIIGLDNDAVFEDATVAARAVAAFAQTPALGVLGFKILRYDGSGLDRFSWGYPAALMGQYEQQFECTTFVGAGHAIRRTAWNAAGGYDARLFFTWEEYDFCLAAIALGWRVRYDGSLAVLHKISPEARVAWQEERVRLFVRNRLVIGRKWGASWAALAPRVAGYLLKFGLHRRLAASLAGVRQALLWDKTMTRRRMTPAMRDYCRRHETQHRGSLLRRFRVEVLGQMKKDR